VPPSPHPSRVKAAKIHRCKRLQGTPERASRDEEDQIVEVENEGKDKEAERSLDGAA
jgi:hypothetical protein